MCTQPLYITKRNFRYLVYSRKVCIPCGECDECLRKKANDLYVRARMEYDSCLPHGNGFMCCLTYSNDIVPTITINGKIRMVFNKLDCIKFIKRLRINLKREYGRKYPNLVVPAFKYLITSEYGTDERYTHRPHYHLLFFFKDAVIPSVFRRCFERSMYIVTPGGVKRCFGIIKQCALLDPKKGGIQYSSKYVCKDIMYQEQAYYIRKQILFNQEKVNNMYGIRVSNSVDTDFRNSVIRSRSDYKKSVETLVRPWRHMLQFYMCSNDLGGTATIEKYGEGLINMPLLNFDGFPYALPKIVRQRFEEKYGFNKSVSMVRTSFNNYLNRLLADMVDKKAISSQMAQDLRVFAHEYCIPYKGNIQLVMPSLDPLDNAMKPFKSWDELLPQLRFFVDNDFFVMKDCLEAVFRWDKSESRLQFRRELARLKNEIDKEHREQRKRNKNV